MATPPGYAPAVGLPTPFPSVLPTPQVPTLPDPMAFASATYDKPMVMFQGGLATIGGRLCVGPWQSGALISGGWHCGCPVNLDGSRALLEIYANNKLIWTAFLGPLDGSAMNVEFLPGTLTQMPSALELAQRPATPCAYRGSMMVFIDGFDTSSFKTPLPYLAFKIGEGGDPAAGINLGDALYNHGLSLWVGFDPTDWEVVGVTDVIKAELFGEIPPFTDSLTWFTRFYPHLVLSRSDKLRLVNKDQSTPDFVLRLEDIVGGSKPVTFAHESPEAVAAAWKLTTVDPDFDYVRVSSLSLREISSASRSETLAYELPVVMDAATRQSLVTYGQFYAENAREKCSLILMPRLLGVEPGDLGDISCLGAGFGENLMEVIEATTDANFQKHIVMQKVLRTVDHVEPPIPEGFQMIWDYSFNHSESGLVVGSTCAPPVDDQIGAAVWQAGTADYSFTAGIGSPQFISSHPAITQSNTTLTGAPTPPSGGTISLCIGVAQAVGFIQVDGGPTSADVPLVKQMIDAPQVCHRIIPASGSGKFGALAVPTDFTVPVHASGIAATLLGKPADRTAVTIQIRGSSDLRVIVGFAWDIPFGFDLGSGDPLP